MFAPDTDRGIARRLLRESYVDEKTTHGLQSWESKSRRRDAPDDILALTDVGAFTPTFIRWPTMKRAQYNKKFVVFDRPNPLGGIVAEGIF